MTVESSAKIRYTNASYIGASPSGKAPGFGPGIREFEPLRPSQSRELRGNTQTVAHTGDKMDFFSSLAGAEGLDLRPAGSEVSQMNIVHL